MSAKAPTKIRRAVRYHTIRFFRLEGSREKAARGFAVGLTCNFFPTFGLGAFLSGFLAKVSGGNVVAGFAGGCLLAFFWPFLFYLNIRTGSLFIRPPIAVDDLEDVTPRVIDALVWGKTFAAGAIVNSAVVCVCAYFLFLAAYGHIRPHVLRRLRSDARRRARAEAAGRPAEKKLGL